MRRNTFAPLVLALLLAVTGAAEAQTLKIGYINSQQIFDTVPEAKKANEQFNADMQGYQTELNQLRSELDRMQQQLDQQQQLLSAEAKKNREQAIQQKATEFEQRAQELNAQAERRRGELMQPLMDKIGGVIEDIRKEGQYSLILDAAAGSILAADTTLDLTGEVIRRLASSSGGGGE